MTSIDVLIADAESASVQATGARDPEFMIRFLATIAWRISHGTSSGYLRAEPMDEVKLKLDDGEAVA